MIIIVFKSRKKLEIWEKDMLLKSYDIAIGKEQNGHKQTEGDFKTPEGDYKIIVKNPKSKYHLSLGINYPNSKDAEEAFKKGVIDSKTRDAICVAERELKIPPWKTPLGGEIYIHGNLEKQNWSQGCIRMYDKDIEELYEQTSIGTAIKILP